VTDPTGRADEATGVGDIGRAAGRGLRWSLIGTIVMRIASFGMGLVLARLLTPSDYGAYAIALSATQFVMHVNDVGLIAAVVQWRGRFESMAPTATSLTIGCSFAVYGAFWLAAPSFAALAGSSQATPLVRLLTLTIIIDGLTAVRSASLMRNFQQDRLMAATGAGFVANFVTSIGLAVTGAGAYAFVLGQLAGCAVTGLVVFVVARVPFRLGMDREVAGKLLRFGLPLAASLGVEAVLMNADYVIIGRLLGVATLGYYLMAFNVSSWAVGLIGTAVRYVSIPAFSRLSDQDDDSLSLGVQRSMPALITVLTPVVVLMSLLAPELIDAFYGEQWSPSAPVLRYLMVLTGVRLIMSLGLDILTGSGATRLILWVNLAWATVLVPSLIVATRFGGIRGTAIAHVLIGSLVALPLGALALTKIGVRVGPILRASVRPLLAGGLAGLTAMITTSLVAAVVGGRPLVQLLAAGAVGTIVYGTVAWPGGWRWLIGKMARYGV
jgi:PST family polysaccharide transporter